MQYLMVRNPGESPVEALYIMGVSTTRFAGSSKTIGKFGSGIKNGINTLLRNDINPTYFTGNVKLEWSTEPLPVDDGLNSHEYRQVAIRLTGQEEVDGKKKTYNKTIKTTTTLEAGVYDWTDVSMGLREIVSNALDRTYRETDSFDAVEIKVVDQARLYRGREGSGFTTAFIPLTPDVQRFYNELHKRFLHFTEPLNLDKKILPKRNRNLSERQSTMVYKQGVFVREFSQDDLPSIYDYNLGDELILDENRHVDDSVIKYAVTKAIVNAQAEELVPVLRAVLNGDKVFEASLDAYYLKDPYAIETVKKAQAEQWQAAWKATAGEDAVAVADKPNLGEYVQKKGYKAKTVKAEGWFAGLESHGVLTDSKVLTEADRNGTTISEATPDMLLAVDKVWNLLKTFDMLNGREKMPPVKAFHEIRNGDSYRLGYYSPLDKTVYIHTEIGTGQSPLLLAAALEETVHYTSGSGDMSRDIQDYLFRLVVKMGL